MDHIDKAARSRNMAAIRSRGNATTERRLRAYLVRNGVSGWVLHPVDVIGTPDVLFRSIPLAVFVDGCFWHGCRHCGHIPASNSVYWSQKINRNRLRDRRVTVALRRRGFRVLRIWEHELRLNPERVIRRLLTLTTAT